MDFLGIVRDLTEKKEETEEKQIESKFRALREQLIRLRDLIQERIKSDTNILQTAAAESKQNEVNKLDNRGTFRMQRRLLGHFGKIYAMHWAHGDSHEIVSAGQDGKMIVWSAYTSYKHVIIDMKSPWIMTCAYSPDNSLISIAGLEQHCTLFNMKEIKHGDWYNGHPHCELYHHKGYISCNRFIDNVQLVTSSGDSTCALWDVERKQVIRTFEGHQWHVECLDVNTEDPHLFLSGSQDAMIKLWDVRQKAVAQTFRGHEADVDDVRWFPSHQAFVSGSCDATARLFDIKACRELNKYHHEEIYASVTAVDFSASGYYLFVAYDEEPFSTVWNTQTAESLSVMDHPARVSALQVSPKGHCIATGSWDKYIRIWA